MTEYLTRRNALALLGGAFASLSGCRGSRQNTVIVGSKNFSEQIVLAELLAQQIEAHSMLRVDRRLNLGGTLICQQALLAGQMDLYAEYTGTALAAILGQPTSHDAEAVYRAVHDGYRDRFGFDVGPPLGFNNTFAIVVRGEDAKSLKLRTISDLVPLRSPLACRIRLRIHGTFRRLSWLGRSLRPEIRGCAQHHGPRLVVPRAQGA